MVGNNRKPNRTKTAAALMMLMLAAYLAPLIIVNAGTGTSPEEASVGLDKIPGIPENTVQYNKTDITPVAQMEQVQAGEPALFCYRNNTMLINCTKNCDVIFTADPKLTPKIFGFSIEPNQSMTLTMNLSGSPLESATVMERTLNFYFGIEPNATLQLSAQLRLHINQTELSQQLNREVNASGLTWMYWNRTRAEWEAVESYMDQNGYLVCNTDHFSTWTVAEISESTGASPEPEPATNGIQTAFVYVGIIAVVLVGLAAGIYANSKRKK
jgi:hypothetical protein